MTWKLNVRGASQVQLNLGNSIEEGLRLPGGNCTVESRIDNTALQSILNSGLWAYQDTSLLPFRDHLYPLSRLSHTLNWNPSEWKWTTIRFWGKPARSAAIHKNFTTKIKDEDTEKMWTTHLTKHRKLWIIEEWNHKRELQKNGLFQRYLSFK